MVYGYLKYHSFDLVTAVVDDINHFFGFPDPKTDTYCKPLYNHELNKYLIPVDSDFLSYFLQSSWFSFELLDNPNDFIINSIEQTFTYEII